MSTVTSITAERAEAIHNASITGAFLSGNNLILRTRGGSEINVGAVKADVLDCWPVGSVFIGYTATSPATLLGGGVWARIAEGRTLVGQTGADVDFDTLGDTGGEKTHVLTPTEMPSHQHTGTTGGQSASHYHHGDTTANGVHNHQFYDGNDNATGASTTRVAPGTSGGSGTPDMHVENAGAHAHAFDTDVASADHTHGFTTNATGGGGAHNNMPPFVIVYIWRRVS